LKTFGNCGNFFKQNFKRFSTIIILMIKSECQWV